MKKYLLTIIFALIIGFFLGNFLLKQYNDYETLTVSSNSKEVYFFQYGVYSNVENMEENTINLENYIYKIEDEKYYVYIGLTGNKNNIDKLSNHYKNWGYDVIVKSYYISNQQFINLLNNFDEVIKNTEDSTVISSIICQTLQKYEDVVNNGNND